MGDEREGAGTGSLVDLMGKDQNLQEEALKRARGYCEKSGVSKIIDELDRERDSRDKIKRFPSLEEGEVTYSIELSRGSRDVHRVDIEVNSKGTIKIRGAFLTGSSTIKEDEWVKDPKLVNKALVKAFRHPLKIYTDDVP
jgi:hypothetical protein